MGQKEKIASYIKAEIADVSGVNLLDIPGDFIVALSNTADEENFIDLKASTIDFSDVREDGKNYCTQKATITCSGARYLFFQSRMNNIIRLTRSDGHKMIVGNNEFPVRFTIEESGKPVQTKIIFEHRHPEHIKELV